MTDLATFVAVRLQNAAARLRHREEGQTLVEYGLILAFVAILIIVSLLFLKDKIAAFFSKAGSSITS